jgi:hypothetical protein
MLQGSPPSHGCKEVHQENISDQSETGLMNDVVKTPGLASALTI